MRLNYCKLCEDVITNKYLIDIPIIYVIKTLSVVQDVLEKEGVIDVSAIPTTVQLFNEPDVSATTK